MLRIIIFLEDVKTTSHSFLEPVDLNKQTFSLMKKKKKVAKGQDTPKRCLHVIEITSPSEKWLLWGLV